MSWDGDSGFESNHWACFCLFKTILPKLVFQNTLKVPHNRIEKCCFKSCKKTTPRFFGVKKHTPFFPFTLGILERWNGGPTSNETWGISATWISWSIRGNPVRFFWRLFGGNQKIKEFPTKSLYKSLIICLTSCCKVDPLQVLTGVKELNEAYNPSYPFIRSLMEVQTPFVAGRVVRSRFCLPSFVMRTLERFISRISRNFQSKVSIVWLINCY